MNSNLFIFAGGGTGGHLYPGLAVAEELVRLRPSARIIFACSNRSIDRRILDGLPYGVVPQPVQPLPRSLSGVLSFLRAWRESGLQARDLVADLQPAGVLGLGGFAAGPLVKQAAGCGVPTALLNPDAVPGKANKHLSRCVDAIFTQFEATTKSFVPACRPKVQALGCPIRAGLLKAGRQDAIEHFGLRPDRKTLLVFGASLGASTINEAMAMLAGDMAGLAGRWQVLHITGASKGGGLAETYASHSVDARCLEYCDRMELAYTAADLTLCRSGASTIAELAATASPAVLMPYPYHKDRQQTLNAAGLADAGAAVICEDAKEPTGNAQRLRQLLLPLMQNDQILAKMKTSAAGTGKPSAAADVAKWLLNSAK